MSFVVSTGGPFPERPHPGRVSAVRKNALA
jgi:hypothetical protein